MKNNAIKIILMALAGCACALLNAEESRTLRAFPISFPAEGSAPIKTGAAVIAEAPEDAEGLVEAAKSAISGKTAVDKNQMRRAAAFKKMVMPDASKILATAKLGKYYAVFPAAGRQLPKGRPNINFMVFEKFAGGYKWLPSFNDPLLQIMADAAANSSEIGRENIKTFSETDAKILDELLKKSLPFLNFANGAFVSLEATPDVDSLEVSKFYRNAQDIFYSWKIDEYGAFLTPRTKAAFDAQYGSMSEQDRKKALGEYFSWGKKYLKALDASPIHVMIFNRTKPGNTPRPDFAYILKDGPEFKIAVLTDSKTPLEAFMGKYILVDTPYIENISKKFAPYQK